MNKIEKMPMWRKALIAICYLLIIACLILVSNIESIINNKELVHYEPSNVFQNNAILKPLLDFYELNDKDRKLFEYENEDLIEKHRSRLRVVNNLDRYVSKLYRNEQFVNIFGKEAFYKTIEEHGERAYQIRLERLRNKTVSEAFNYLYSPFTKNGSRDNSKGLGAEWEKYAQMSIPEKEYYIRSDIQERYDTLVKKENDERELWRRSLLSLVLLIGIIIFLLIAKKPGKINCHARTIIMYYFLCVAINYIIHQFLVIFEPYKADTEPFIIFCFLFPLLTLSIMEVFVANRSKEDYFNYYLIPDKISENMTNNDYKKRLLMIFLIYPLFYIIPIPFVGFFIFLSYILPVSLIIGIVWIVLWIKKAKNIDEMSLVQDGAGLYCRHCGKLIDADSDYCRYCGKKL